MKQRTKDLILIYTIFFLFACILLGINYFIKYNSEIQSNYNATQKSSDNLPVIYDSYIYDIANNIEVVYQLPEFKSGDEFAAAVSFLNACGYDVNFYDLLNLMSYSDTDYVTKYVGDAKTDTGYCYSPALVICMNRYLQSVNSTIRVQNYTGLSYRHLQDKVRQGNPYIVWLTDNYTEPEYVNTYYDNINQLYTNSHTVIVYNIDNDKVYIADSVNGEVTMNITDFKALWEKCGKQAIGIQF